MKIVVCGPKHSGKSVFLRWLINVLPTEGVMRIDASPDGESMWSGSPDAEEVEEVRLKGEYTDKLVEQIVEVLRKHDERIDLVDVGGMLDSRDSKNPLKTGQKDKIKANNMKMFSECDAFICVSKDPEKAKEWYDFCTKEVVNTKTGKPLQCIALIDSFDPDDPKYKKEKCTVEEAKDDIVRAKMYCLKRGRNVSNDARLVLKATMKKLLQITREEAKPLEKYDVDGFDLATKAGIVEYIGEDPTKFSRRIRFPRADTEKIYKAIEEQDFDESIQTGKPVTVGNINNGRVLVAACDALRKKGVQNIEVFDAISLEMKPIKKIEESKMLDEHFCLFNDSIIAMHRVETINATFLNIDIFGSMLAKKDYLEDFQMPAIDDNKVLYISGKIPYYLLASICLSSNAKTIYTFTPGDGFTCVKHEGEKSKHQIGRVVKEIVTEEGINTRLFFRHRKEGKLTGKGMDYIDPKFYTEEQLDELRLLNLPDDDTPEVTSKINRNPKGKGSKRKPKGRDKRIRGTIHVVELTKSQQFKIQQMKDNSKAKREKGPISLRDVKRGKKPEIKD